MYHLVKIAHAISDKKTFKNNTILDFYIAQGQGQITLRRQNFNCKKSFITLIIHCKFLPLAFNTV